MKEIHSCRVSIVYDGLVRVIIPTLPVMTLSIVTREFFQGQVTETQRKGGLEELRREVYRKAEESCEPWWLECQSCWTDGSVFLGHAMLSSHHFWPSHSLDTFLHSTSLFWLSLLGSDSSKLDYVPTL